MKILKKNVPMNEDFNKDVYSAVARFFGYRLSDKAQEVMTDLVERALDNKSEGVDTWDAVAEAVDEGLIYTNDIWAIKREYGDSNLTEDEYDSLTSDLSSIVDELTPEDDDEVDDSLENF